MKTNTHPTYFEKATVVCGCGKKFILGSTVEHLSVEICSNCHPFYTGKEKLIDTAGKVEKFKAKRAKAATVVKKEKKVRVAKNKK